MKGVTESMAGRTAVFTLLPLSAEEAPGVGLMTGGFPEVLASPRVADLWFRSYVQTYLERDVRAVTSIRDLATFRRFMRLLASRCGQMLNKTEIASPLGVSVPTVTQWLSVLEVTGQILLIPPFYENFGKRLVKTPKLYFVDSGLAAHLLGVLGAGSLDTSPFYGPLFEGLVASELAKCRLNRGRNSGLYYFRDRQGLEVDFILDRGDNQLVLMEAKATRTPRPRDADALVRLASSVTPHTYTSHLVYLGTSKAESTRALRPGVSATSWRALAAIAS